MVLILNKKIREIFFKAFLTERVYWKYVYFFIWIKYAWKKHCLNFLIIFFFIGFYLGWSAHQTGLPGRLVLIRDGRQVNEVPVKNSLIRERVLGPPLRLTLRDHPDQVAVLVQKLLHRFRVDFLLHAGGWYQRQRHFDFNNLFI